MSFPLKNSFITLMFVLFFLMKGEGAAAVLCSSLSSFLSLPKIKQQHIQPGGAPLASVRADERGPTLAMKRRWRKIWLSGGGGAERKQGGGHCVTPHTPRTPRLGAKWQRRAVPAIQLLKDLSPSSSPVARQASERPLCDIYYIFFPNNDNAALPRTMPERASRL